MTTLDSKCAVNPISQIAWDEGIKGMERVMKKPSDIPGLIEHKKYDPPLYLGSGGNFKNREEDLKKWNDEFAVKEKKRWKDFDASLNEILKEKENG